MTDETRPSPDAGAPDPEPPPAPEPAPAPGLPPAEDASRTWEPAGEPPPVAREWLGQLQQMIDRVATEAAPVAREIAAKAAELAAVAGEKAGPLARRAAEVTGDVGTRVAERSRHLADELRHAAPGSEAGPGTEAASDAAEALPVEPDDPAGTPGGADPAT